jgi:hypothetical protein
MVKPKKRPSKAAKAAKRILKESELLRSKTEADSNAGSEFRPANVMRKTSPANKPRPDKKRG